MCPTSKRWAPVAVRDKTRLYRIAYIEQRQAAISPGSIGHRPGNNSMMERITLPGVPRGRLSPGVPHTRNPPASHDAWSCRVSHIDNNEDMIGIANERSRRI